jgi:DNA replication protein DnaC
MTVKPPAPPALPDELDETLAQLLRRHRADDSINKAIARLIRADLVVIDDVGPLAVSTDAAEALFRVIDATYEKARSRSHPTSKAESAAADEAQRAAKREARAKLRAGHRQHLSDRARAQVDALKAKLKAPQPST